MVGMLGDKIDGKCILYGFAHTGDRYGSSRGITAGGCGTLCDQCQLGDPMAAAMA